MKKKFRKFRDIYRHSHRSLSALFWNSGLGSAPPPPPPPDLLHLWPSRLVFLLMKGRVEYILFYFYVKFLYIISFLACFKVKEEHIWSTFFFLAPLTKCYKLVELARYYLHETQKISVLDIFNLQSWTSFPLVCLLLKYKYFRI